MEGLDKTLLTSNEQELKKIYDEEVQKLMANEFKMKILQSLTIEDFPRDIPESSKKNLERALLAAKIRDQINLGQNQKLLGDIFITLNDQTKYFCCCICRTRWLRHQQSQLELHGEEAYSRACRTCNQARIDETQASSTRD